MVVILGEKEGQSGAWQRASSQSRWQVTRRIARLSVCRTKCRLLLTDYFAALQQNKPLTIKKGKFAPSPAPGQSAHFHAFSN
jgi:hypothetical protein